MTLPATPENVGALLAGFLKVPKARVASETRLEELGLDSLAAVELVFELEEKFGVSIPNASLDGLAAMSVRKVAEGLRSLQEAKP